MRIPDTGRIVNCDTPDAPAAQVIEMLSDRGKLACMGQAARKWVEDRFDWSALGQQAEEIFAEVVPKGRRRIDRR
jgi:glycosyltransferase involved in cell wall biosynthesis